MKFLLTLMWLLIAASSYAQSKIVSIDAFDLSYTGGLLFKSDNSKSGPDRDETKFRFNLNYAQNLDSVVGLMWKAQFHFNRSTIDYGANDSTRSEFGVDGGVLYNFQADDIKNSIFAGAMVGIERGRYDNGVSDDAGFNLDMQFEGGKRWDLGHYAAANISYAPTISLLFKRYGGDIRDNQFKNGNEIKLNFLKFDILF